jgi:colanic acid/amylovoran biosynthesis glycosyltransferase
MGMRVPEDGGSASERCPMRVAYLVDAYHRPTETFVRDAVVGLRAKVGAVRVCCRKRFVNDSAVASVGRGAANSLLLGALTALEKRMPPVGLSGLRRLREGRLATLHLRALDGFPCDIVFADFGPTGRVARRVAQKLGRPFVVHFHGYDASARLAEADYGRAIRHVVADAACVITPSHHLRRRLQAHCGPGETRFEVVPYGPSAESIEAARSLAKTQPSPVPLVVALGRLTEKKQPLALLEAFQLVKAEVPDAKLIIVGDGELRPAVESRIRVLGLESAVTLTGALPHDEALARIARGWVFAQHSATSARGDQEGMPLAILEAMSLGLPVVSTWHSGIPEAVEHEVTGLLVSEFDFEAMGAAIVRLLRDADARERMGAAAQAIAREKFNLNVRLDRLVSTLQECVANPVGGRSVP